MPSAVVTTVSSILAPGRLGFQASAVFASIVSVQARQREHLARQVAGRAALVVEQLGAGMPELGVGARRSRRRPRRASCRAVETANVTASTRATCSMSVAPRRVRLAEVHEAGQVGVEAVPPTAEHQHRARAERVAGGGRVAVDRQAPLAADQRQRRLDAALPERLGAGPGELPLGPSGRAGVSTSVIASAASAPSERYRSISVGSRRRFAATSSGGNGRSPGHGRSLRRRRRRPARRQTPGAPAGAFHGAGPDLQAVGTSSAREPLGLDLVGQHPGPVAPSPAPRPRRLGGQDHHARAATGRPGEPVDAAQPRGDRRRAARARHGSMPSLAANSPEIVVITCHPHSPRPSTLRGSVTRGRRLRVDWASSWYSFRADRRPDFSDARPPQRHSKGVPETLCSVHDAEPPTVDTIAPRRRPAPAVLYARRVRPQSCSAHVST